VDGGFSDIVMLGQDVMDGHAGYELEVTIFYGACRVGELHELGLHAQGKWGAPYGRLDSAIQKGEEVNPTHASLCRVMGAQGMWQETGDDFQYSIWAPGRIHGQPAEILQNFMDGGRQAHIVDLLVLLPKKVLQHTEQTRSAGDGEHHGMQLSKYLLSFLHGGTLLVGTNSVQDFEDPADAGSSRPPCPRAIPRPFCEWPKSRCQRASS
jgi:hypothetical protein